MSKRKRNCPLKRKDCKDCKFLYKQVLKDMKRWVCTY